MSTTFAELAKQYHRSKYFFFADALWSLLRYGATPNEYTGFEFWRLSSLERKQFYTARYQPRFERLLNDRAYYDTFCRKEQTNRAFAQFVHRDWLYTPDATDDEIVAFLNTHAKVIVKPVGLSSGRGIHVYKDERADVLRNSCTLLEEFVEQCPEMMAINPTSVNTVRVYTLLCKSSNSTPPPCGDVLMLSIGIRAGGAGAEVDNFHAGGVLYPVDKETGIVYGPGKDILGHKHLFHPSTGLKMIGFEIPRFAELRTYVEALARHIPRARFIAWDIAVTPTGFDLIEANYEGDPGVMQAPHIQGKLREIKDNI